MPRKLTKKQRWSIITFSDTMSHREIAKAVGCSRTTVERVIELFERTGDVLDAKTRRPHTKIHGAVAALVLDEMVGKTNKSTRKAAMKLRRDLGVRVDHGTIARFLHAEGYSPRHRLVSVALTRAQKTRRLNWCRRFSDKSKEWWEKVAFLDEKNFGAAWPGNRHNDTVWGNAITVIPERHVSRYQASAKIGAVMSYKGVSKPYEVKGSWNGPAYGRMLRECVFPTLRRHYHGEEVVVFQDNDPSHLTAVCKKRMRAEGVLFEGDYKFPPNSGDLNPVENLWSIVLEEMETGDVTSKEEIVDAVKSAWRKVKKSSIHKMLHSMPQRVADCIALEGDRTRW